MSFQFIIYFASITISFLSGLTVYFSRGAMLYLKLFPILLLGTLAVELTGYFLQRKGIHTAGIYNIFNIVSTSFYFFLLYEILKSSATKKMIIWFALIFVIFALWNIFFWQGMSDFDNITFALGSLFIVGGC